MAVSINFNLWGIIPSKSPDLEVREGIEKQVIV